MSEHRVWVALTGSQEIDNGGWMFTSPPPEAALPNVRWVEGVLTIPDTDRLQRLRTVARVGRAWVDALDREEAGGDPQAYVNGLIWAIRQVTDEDVSPQPCVVRAENPTAEDA